MVHKTLRLAYGTEGWWPFNRMETHILSDTATFDLVVKHNKLIFTVNSCQVNNTYKLPLILIRNLCCSRGIREVWLCYKSIVIEDKTLEALDLDVDDTTE